MLKTQWTRLAIDVSVLSTDILKDLLDTLLLDTGWKVDLFWDSKDGRDKPQWGHLSSQFYTWMENLLGQEPSAILSEAALPICTTDNPSPGSLMGTL